jgi:hypothetical protein
VGNFWRGRGGGRSPNWCQAAQPEPSFQREAAAHAHNSNNRQAHAIGTSHSCCVNVMSCHVVRVMSIGREDEGEDENRTVRMRALLTANTNY